MEKITVKEAAKRAEVHTNTLRIWIKKGLLPAEKRAIGMRYYYLIDVKDLNEFLEKNTPSN